VSLRSALIVGLRKSFGYELPALWVVLPMAFDPAPASSFLRYRMNIQIWGDFVTQHVLFIVTNAAIIGPRNRRS
jgi:hypothetical protein